MPAVFRIVGWILLSVALLLLLLAAVLHLFNWNLVKDEIAAALSERMGMTVEIAGDLDVDVGRFTHVRADDIRLYNAAAPRERLLAADRFRLGVDIGALWTGRLVLTEIVIVEPRVLIVRDARGELNWPLPPADETEAPEALPIMRRARIEGGAVIYRDAALDEPVEMSIERIQGEADRNGTLTASGAVQIKSHKVQLQVQAQRTQDGEDWRMDAALTAADARLSIVGTVGEPDLAIDLRVPDPRQLGLPPLDDVSPIHVTGRVLRDQGHWWFDKLELVAGKYRLDGQVRLDAAQDRPMIYATLYMNKLRWPDVEEVEREEVIPPIPIETTPLRQMNLRANLRIGEVTNSPIPMSDVRLSVNLRDGRLAIDPVSARVAQGQVQGSLALDARQPAATAIVRLSLEGLRQPPLIPEDAVSGAISGRIDLRGRGNTLEELAGALDGQVLFVIRQGAIPRAWVAAIALDVADYLFAGDPEADRTPIRCGFIAFTVENGVLRAQPVVVDTEDFVMILDGTIGLGAEKLDLALAAYPKEFSPLAFRGPIELSGPLTEPSVDLPIGEIAGRGAAALALGALAAPLAGLIPLMQPGIAEDQNCRELLAGALPKPPAPGGK